MGGGGRGGGDRCASSSPPLSISESYVLTIFWDIWEMLSLGVKMAQQCQNCCH